MSLQFIFGNSGSGKSFYLYQKVIEESRRHPERSFLVIVPEQFTLQTQQDLVRLHPDHGIMNIDVLSFRRLAHRVFEEVGADQRTVLTETGKNLMLRRVAQEQKDNLKVLGARMNRSGYVSEVKSILSELMQYEITDDDLQGMLEAVSDRPLLCAKLEDIRILYRAFLEYQQERFMKPEELMEVLARVSGQSELLRRSVLAFDGYAGFTPSQLTVLEELLSVCPKIYMTVTIDARENFYGTIKDYELFAPSRRLIRSVSERCQNAMAKGNGGFEDPVVLGVKNVGSHLPGSSECPAKAGKAKTALDRVANPMPFASGREAYVEGDRRDPLPKDLPRFSLDGALRHLEQNLFRPKSMPYHGTSDEISLHVLSSPMQEVHFAARSIAHLVREGHYRYRDIAVIAGDLSAYGDYVKNIFPMYGISAFVDETHGLLLNPCLEFVRGALALVQEDFSRESVFRFLRTGMVGFAPEEIDWLENFVIAAGIHGRRRWEEEWTWCPAGLGSVRSVSRMAEESSSEEDSLKETDGEETFQEESAESMAGLDLYNALRRRFMEKVGDFAEKMSQKDCPLLVYAQALYQLLEDCAVQQQLKDTQGKLSEHSTLVNTELASEYRQIYPILIGLLDEMADLLGEEKMDCREFAQILDAGLSEAKVGVIPPGIDQVQVGDIRRSRLSNVRILFFLGLNDGWVPARGDQVGIVSDTEREILLNLGAQLAPSARENSYIQRFYLYQNLTKPQERLYLSWCQSSGDGTAMRPSYLVAVLEKMFPNMKVQPEADAGTMLDGVTSKENGMLYFLHGLQKIRDPHGGVVDPNASTPPGNVEDQNATTPSGNVEDQNASTPLENVEDQNATTPSGNVEDRNALMPRENGLASWLELYRMYLNDDNYRDRVRTLARAAFGRGPLPDTEHLDAQTARELYGMNDSAAGPSRDAKLNGNGDPAADVASAEMFSSVTRLEQYAGCAFSHFAAYGLRLQERAEYGVKAVDLGNLFHESLELFSREMIMDGCDWGECPYEEQARRMDRCVEKAAGRYEDGILHGSAREEYTIQRLKRILRRTVWVLRKQTRAGKFRPVGFEISFADTQDLDAVQVRLEDQSKIRLQGRIDRIDTAQSEDTIYVKVVDYKSGMTQFDPVALYYGLQVQLIVYLNAALEMEQKLHPGKKVIPAGIFYHRMQDPVLDREDSAEHASETLLKKMRPNGLVNGDGPILRLFDENLSGDSLVIPVGLKKDGTPKASSSLATTGQFFALSKHVTHLLGQMAEEIMSGSIGAHPYTDKNRDTCEYCGYADVCGFDRKIPGRCEKRVPQLDAAEIIERLSNAERYQDDRRDLPPNGGEGARSKRLSVEEKEGGAVIGGEMDEGAAAGH